jgi:putative phage-type endonuclease
MDEWFKDLTLQQGSDEWKAARTKRLGGSEIASVLRLSPYKTRYQLWEEKTGRKPQADISNMPHVKRGIDAEPIARKLIEGEHGVKYTTPTLIHPEYSWAVASLDGLCDGHVLEIKTMGLEKHLAVKAGEIPDYYLCQMQWQMMIAGRELALFASYRPEDGSLYTHWVVAEKSDQEMMLEEAKRFWHWVANDIEPEDDFIYEVKND